MKPPSINKIIYLMVATGIILMTAKILFAQGDADVDMMEGQYGWYYKLDTAGNTLISIAAVLSFLLYRKYFPAFASFCYIALVLIVILLTANDFGRILKKPILFFSVRGIGTYLNFGLIFFAGNHRYLDKVLRIFHVACVGFVIAGLFGMTTVGIGASRQEYLRAIREITVALIWIFPFFFLQKEKDHKIEILNTILLFIIGIFILGISARSYLLILACYVLVKFRHQLRSKNGIIFIFAALFIGVGGFFLLLNSGMSKSIEGALDILSDRSNDDSRSGQIIEFLKQWDPGYFIQGAGPFKTWYWSGVGDKYFYLDNQFLLIGWWGGLPFLFIYMYLLIKTCFTRPEIRLYKEVNGMQLIIGIWILACLGLSIYINISPSIYYYFISIIIGYNLCKFTKIKDFESERDET